MMLHDIVTVKTHIYLSEKMLQISEREMKLCITVFTDHKEGSYVLEPTKERLKIKGRLLPAVILLQDCILGAEIQRPLFR